jgi:hypothetical protein
MKGLRPPSHTPRVKVEARHKLEPMWTGPYEIKEMIRPNAIIQELGKRKHQEVLTNRLKTYFSSFVGKEAEFGQWYYSYARCIANTIANRHLF